MNIEVRKPELKALIQPRMVNGAFNNEEDALLDRPQVRSAETAPKKPTSNRTGADIVAMQAMPYKDEIEFGGSRPNNESFLELSKSVSGLLTDEEVDTLFARDRSRDRSIDLS